MKQWRPQLKHGQGQRAPQTKKQRRPSQRAPQTIEQRRPSQRAPQGKKQRRPSHTSNPNVSRCIAHISQADAVARIKYVQSCLARSVKAWLSGTMHRAPPPPRRWLKGFPMVSRKRGERPAYTPKYASKSSHTNLHFKKSLSPP